MGSILLNKFKWGHAFYTLNAPFLDAYTKCDSTEAMIECDTRFRTGQENFNNTYSPNHDMPPSESSDDEDLHVENLSLNVTIE